MANLLTVFGIIVFIVLAAAWVTFFPAVGVLYIAGYLQ